MFYCLFRGRSLIEGRWLRKRSLEREGYRLREKVLNTLVHAISWKNLLPKPVKSIQSVWTWQVSDVSPYCVHTLVLTRIDIWWNKICNLINKNNNKIAFNNWSHYWQTIPITVYDEQHLSMLMIHLLRPILMDWLIDWLINWFSIVPFRYCSKALPVSA